MRTFFAIILLATAFLGIAQNNSDSTGLPGDNLDLNGVLAIFKDSKNPEDFEKQLNSADTKINNLDLNHDGQVDYLSVSDYGKGDSHSLVIRDHISASESQDVAVIEAEKKGDKNVNVQIVGDEDLYGKDYIIDPQTESSAAQSQNVPDDVYQTAQVTPTVVYVNAWAWPCVSYMYAPGYAFWVSPWYWGYYPGWWSPWAPYGWWAYRANMYPHHYWYYGHRSYVNRNSMAHNMYYGHRASSDYVRKSVQLSHTGRPVMNRNAGNNNAPRRQGQMRQPAGNMNAPHTTSRGNRTFNQNPGMRTAPSRRQFPMPASRPAPPNRFGGGNMGGGMNRMGGGHMGGGMRGGRR